MSDQLDHLVDLSGGHSSLDDAEERWTEPLNPGTNPLIGSDFIHKPATSKIGHSRTIIHFDIDCFYAQVEMLRNPELQNKPLGIQQKNFVVTTNYIARQCGVPKSTSVTDAKKICPDLVLVCGEDLTNYRQMSYRISEFLQKYTPCVERLGFDENFIDASELVRYRLQDGAYKEEFVGHVYHGNCQGIDRSHCRCGCELRLQIGSQIAAEIREALHRELGITSCAGIGHNKLLAKVVAGTHKPSQQTTVLPHVALELVSSFSSVVCIPGIGYKTTYRLNALGLSSVVDLQAADKQVLVKEFGPQMTQLMDQLSYGVDDSPVVAYSLPQTLSDEDAFKCCKDTADVERRIKELTTNLLKRVAEDGRIPQTVRLTVRRIPNKYHRETRQCPVPSNIFTKFLQSSVSEGVVERLMPILMNLFSKLVDPLKPFHLTLIGICFAKLKPADDLGSIGAFFTPASTVSQCAVVTNKTMDSLSESKQFNPKCSKVDIEFKTKPEAKVKTMKHFFPMANTEADSACLQKYNTAGWKASQQSLINRSDVSLAVTDLPLSAADLPLSAADLPLSAADLPLSAADLPLSAADLPLSAADLPLMLNDALAASDVSLRTKESLAATDVPLAMMPSARTGTLSAVAGVPMTVINTCERPLTSGCTQRHTTKSNLNSLQSEPKDSSTAFPKPQHTVAAPISHIGCSEEKSEVTNDSSSTTEVDSTEQHCLQKLLSAGIDVKTVTELPLHIQNEVLLQYGIYVEDLPQGRRFAHISNKARTRSSKTPQLTAVNARSLRAAKKKTSTKRNLEVSLLDAEVADRNSKQRKTDIDNTKNEASLKVTLSENEEYSKTAEAFSERSVVKDSFSCIIIGEQQNVEITASEHSSAVKEEKSRTSTYSLCSSISTLPDKESNCVNVSELSGRESDGVSISNLLDKESDGISISCLPGKESDTNISQLPDNEFAWSLPGQHTNMAVPNVHLDTCIMGLGLQSNSRLASYSSAECQEPVSVTVTPPAQIPSHPCRKARSSKLPDGIDSEVFSSLPSNIRGEIMAHVVMGTLDSSSGQHVKLATPDHNRNMKQITNTKKKNHNSLLTYFKTDNTDLK